MKIYLGQRGSGQPAAQRRQRTPSARMGRWAVLGAVIGLLVATLWFAPARWLVSGIAWASQGQVQLLSAQGSVWSGSALVSLTGGRNSRDQMALPGRMQWRIRPAWLGANVDILPDCCASQPAQVQLRLGWQRVDLAGAHAMAYSPGLAGRKCGYLARLLCQPASASAAAARLAAR